LLVLGDIHLVEETNANVYLIAMPDTLIVVDAGLPGMERLVLKYIDENNLDRNREPLIIVTHAHYDHVGGLSVLKKALNARVACHADEEPYVRGLKYIGRYKHEPVEVDLVLRDGDVVAGRLLVIHTPGHTPGSICLLDAATKALFTGDLVYEESGVLHEIPHHYSLNPVMNREQIKKLAQLDFQHVLPSHGKPLIGVGKEKWLELVERLG